MLSCPSTKYVYIIIMHLKRVCLKLSRKELKADCSINKAEWEYNKKSSLAFHNYHVSYNTSQLNK